MLQEVLRLIYLEINIVIARLGTEPNLFDLCLMNVCAMEFFLLLILELAKVHDPTDRRLFARGHLDQIETGFASPIQRLFSRNDAELSAVSADHPDRRDPDLFVDALLFLDGLRLPGSDANAEQFRRPGRQQPRGLYSGTIYGRDTPPRLCRGQATNSLFASAFPNKHILSQGSGGNVNRPAEIGQNSFIERESLPQVEGPWGQTLGGRGAACGLQSSASSGPPTWPVAVGSR